MLHRTYPDQDCSIARALEVAGERWSLLVLRDVMFGAHRFDGLQSGLGFLSERGNRHEREREGGNDPTHHDAGSCGSMRQL